MRDFCNTRLSVTPAYRLRYITLKVFSFRFLAILFIIQKCYRVGFLILYSAVSRLLICHARLSNTLYYYIK
jgi:hypothetical protein